MTKGQLCDMAREEAGLAGFTFDATPEEKASHLRRLDAMMATWPWSALGYNAPAAIGGSAAEDALGIPSRFLEAASGWLALRIQPGIGKSMSPEARAALAHNLGLVRAFAGTAAIGAVALPSGTLRGAGNKPLSTWNPY